MSVRILVDARIGWGSGIGRHAANMVPRVAALLPQLNFDVMVCGESEQVAHAATRMQPNITVIVSGIGPFSLSEQLRFNRIAQGYDFVWFTNYWVPLAYRGRFIAIVHDLLHQESALFPASRAKRILSWLTFRHVSRSAQAICFVSRFSKREFERRFGRHPRSVVTSCGIDHAGWKLFDPEAPPPKKPRLLVVAAAKKHKNFITAIKAFSRARIAPHWQLTIITPDDKLRSSIDVEQLALNADNVEFRQGVSNDELRAIYAETAILLMPSFYEGFGLPLAEGLQAGAVCISSTAPSLVELGLGAHVTYADPHDVDGWVQAIELECARFDTKEVSAEETRANMRHALQFTWDAVAEKAAILLADLLPSPTMHQHDKTR